MQTTAQKPLATPPPLRERLAAWLVFAGGEVVLGAKWFSLEAPTLAIGREAQDGIAVPDDIMMSRQHATIRRGPAGRLTVVDERSRNGTAVNGKRISEQLVKKGDIISCGDSCLVIAEVPAGIPDAAIPALRGEAAAMRRLRANIMRLAPAESSVLIEAETGCGKELVARALHEHSHVEGEFVAFNCAAIPETLAESLLFGHVANAFNNAAAQPGLFRAAHRGTLFLDEIGELSPVIQAKLLRALEERTVLPVGATKPVPAAPRVLAATHRSLAEDVKCDRFRGDLYARLRQLRLGLPPLRDRREDLFGIFQMGLGSAGKRLTHALAEALLVYDWPYNVRELLAVARELDIIGSDAERLEVAPFYERITGGQASGPGASRTSGSLDESPLERSELVQLLREHRGVVANVAKAVNRSRRQVYRWMAQLEINPNEFR